MRKFLIACSFSVIAAFGLLSCGNHLFDFEDPDARMVEALQQALVLGSKTAASNLGDSSCTSRFSALGDCTKGYLGNKLVEIAVPDTVKNVLDKISSFTNAINALPIAPSFTNKLSGLDKYKEEIKIALNRGAEQAAPKSIDVFKDAILGMSFSNAKGMLMGDSVAATTYLHETTYNGLQSTFAPIIKIPLDLLNPNAFWKPIASNYNTFKNEYSSITHGNSALPSLPYNALPEDISEYLSEYATGKALDGLFEMVGRQEIQLRADPWGTVQALSGFITDGVGELLGDVFGRAKDGLL